MNPLKAVVKEEVEVPQAMEGLHDAGPPPFLTKIYEMVDDRSMDHIVSWRREGQSFVVWDPLAFSSTLLPRYFKHNNFSSFVRQLNTYGFRKIDPDVWEFANEAFLQGQKHILKNIKRRKAPQPAIDPPVEHGGFGSDSEATRHKQDKQVLMMELVNLRQQQVSTRAHLQAMELKLQGTEKNQQKMMGFLAKAMQNPEFIQKLVRNGKGKEVEEAVTNKRRRPINASRESSQIGGGSNLIKAEPVELGDFEMSELEALALEMQGFSRAKIYQEEVPEERDEFKGGNRELDEEFWEELFTERVDEQFGSIGSEGDVEYMNFLAGKLNFLGSSSK